MDAAADRPEFAPPRHDAMGRGLVLALVAHALLVAGLASGLRWQRDTQVAVEAELWAAVPQEAAPPEPPQPPPAPPPQPTVKAPPQPDPQLQRDAQIAREREKKREAEEMKKAELEREREERRKLEAKKKREEELAKKKEEARLVAEAKRKEEEKKRKEQEAREARDAKLQAQRREENLRRMQAMAGTGGPSSTGTAAKASGPSAGWGAKVNARVRPNIVFTDHVDGNPKAEVEVRTSPDGTIVARKLVRSSGVKSWDEAVLRALDKTESLPRDVDGRVPSPVVIEFRPKG